jgi:hypothetical protein
MVLMVLAQSDEHSNTGTCVVLSCSNSQLIQLLAWWPHDDYHMTSWMFCCRFSSQKQFWKYMRNIHIRTLHTSKSSEAFSLVSLMTSGWHHHDITQIFGPFSIEKYNRKSPIISHQSSSFLRFSFVLTRSSCVSFVKSCSTQHY